ncbi:hypothetical protein LCM4576_31225 [Mesorhizobium sp. LCM 4576]|uniref:Transmembrane protein n=2 Tax=Mesorhizobium TaxID=68287 RepID=A0A090FXC9_MESPL|nr:hypothetical protein [Mesorhizobium sp. LCM 4576]OHV63063.1 hypothetical protein LCM4576_31225 [Mesorhizobium sp. LCM 4576]CDX51894.1 conserved membrane hypothetical protein [Mesorhizobium plurifarium]
MIASSLRTLALALDRFVAGNSFVHETPETIIVSELAAEAVLEVSQGFAEVGWRHVVFDGAGSETEHDDIADDFGPYRISAQKPKLGADEILLLTASGFGDWLAGSALAKTVIVVGLDTAIATEEVRFVPLESTNFDLSTAMTLRSPRTLVHEYGALRVVPQSIGRWLLSDPKTWSDANQRFRQWAEHAIRAILPSLANEIDQNTGAYVFRGPPRLSLPPVATDADTVRDLGKHGFGELQAAARWVYELDREAETKHTLFATELARTGGNHADTIKCIKENVAFALEGAKIAYQMSLAKVSADNLRALADLRKAVTDETGKITDATRQVAAAVASALGIGIGLIAARVAANAPSLLIVAVMTIVCAYIFVVIYSGHRFAALQRQLRDVWRNQIYRFLSEEDYSKLVVRPGRDAERILNVVSLAGGIAVAVTFVVAITVALAPARDTVPARSQPGPASAQPTSAGSRPASVTTPGATP